MTVEDGGAVSNTDGYLGYFLGESTATVTGADSTWTNSQDLILGGATLTAATTGSGTLTIADGGTVTVGGTTRVHGNNPSTINLQAGGKLVTHNFDATGGGIFNFKGGTLELTGGTFGGDLDLVSGTTLAGTGTIDGNLSLAGTLDPGNSPGTLAIDGDLTWHGGGRVHFDLGVGQSDLIDISGSLLKGAPGTWNFHFSDPGDFAPGTYTLLTFAGTDFTLADFSFTSDIAGFGGSFQFGGGGLQFSAVPEPSSLLLVSVGLLLGCRRRRSDWSQVA
jgi:T5SS/PEP-CTERM-associated repeat protein